MLKIPSSQKSFAIAGKPIFMALFIAGVVQANTAHAVLATGDVLTINSGVFDTNGYVSGGSYFGMDMSGDGRISIFEKTAINYSTAASSGCTPGPVSVAGGIPIGSTIAASAHTGCINGSESPAFDIWEFAGSTGMDFIQTTPVTDNGNNTLNLSGWRVTWNNVPAINMGGGAWQPGNCAALGCSGWTFTDGTARFQWNGVYGSTYILDYTAVVPAGDPSNFGGTYYYLHLEGIVQAVPIPAAVWLFGSGLFSLMGIVAYKKKPIH